MQDKVSFFLGFFARDHGVPEDAIYALADAISGRSIKSPKGVLGIRTEKSNRKQGWLEDLEDGVKHFKRLLEAFEGDTQKAAAAYMASEAEIRALQGDEWRKHVPTTLR